MSTSKVEERKTFIHLVRSGVSVARAAQEVGRSRAWGNKWWRRFRCNQDWDALLDQSRAPQRQPTRLPDQVYQAVRRVRSELEAEARQPDTLGYVGAHTIRARLEEQGVSPVPSVSSIERELRRADMTRAHQKVQAAEIEYPHLHPTGPHELNQADIVPRSLTGGTAVACFNAIDVVSRYPSGRQYANRTAQNAGQFLWLVWQEQGLPLYQQVDNESCFSGGHTHPGVIGQVVRLALLSGVQLVFSPYYHPESNGTVERFHQDYTRFVWQKALLPDLPAVRQRSALFFRTYRASRHHTHLQGRSPTECHLAQATRRIPEGFRLPERLPLTAGQVHFIRAVDEQQRIKVLNLQWQVPKAQPRQGVWVTLNITLQSATLSVFDAAPDMPKRTCLVKHPFPLKEQVVPLPKEFQPKQGRPTWFERVTQALDHLLYRLSTIS